MSARIPVGWSPCVKGERIPVGIPLERLDRHGRREYGVYTREGCWAGLWLAYRVVEAERPPLEYPIEPVLTKQEAGQLANNIAYRVCDGWSYRGDIADLKQVVREEALKITREVGR